VSPLLLRIGASAATALGTAAGIVAANPSLVSAALPAPWAAGVSLVALVIAGVLHQQAHTATPAPSAPPPADPASKEAP